MLSIEPCLMSDQRRASMAHRFAVGAVLCVAVVAMQQLVWCLLGRQVKPAVAPRIWNVTATAHVQPFPESPHTSVSLQVCIHNHSAMPAPPWLRTTHLQPALTLVSNLQKPVCFQLAGQSCSGSWGFVDMAPAWNWSSFLAKAFQTSSK